MERYNCEEFFNGFPTRANPRRFEQLVVKRFNEVLEVFPPGAGPHDVIDDAFRRGLIKDVKCCDGRRRIIYTRARRKVARRRR